MPLSDPALADLRWRIGTGDRSRHPARKHATGRALRAPSGLRFVRSCRNGAIPATSKFDTHLTLDFLGGQRRPEEQGHKGRDGQDHQSFPFGAHGVAFDWDAASVGRVTLRRSAGPGGFKAGSESSRELRDAPRSVEIVAICSESVRRSGRERSAQPARNACTSAGMAPMSQTSAAPAAAWARVIPAICLSPTPISTVIQSVKRSRRPSIASAI